MAGLKLFSEKTILFQAIFENSFESIVIIDDRDCLVEINTCACNLFDGTKEELLGRSVFDFLIGTLDSANNEERIQIRYLNGHHKTLKYKLIEDVLPHHKLLILRDITPLRQAEEELHHQHQRVKLFSEVTFKISQSLQLQEILQTAVTEVQRILKADRVLIYQFLPNGTGMAISEAVLPDCRPVLGIEFPEEVFPEEYKERYEKGRVRAVYNVHSKDANVIDCLVDFLNEWNVKAKLVVPILQNLNAKKGKGKRTPKLWGLLIAHQCKNPRQWQDFELELMQQLAAQIGIALSQAKLRGNLEELVAQRTAKLRQANINLQEEINDRLEAEAALRRSEEKLSLIANGIPVLIAYVDRHQCYRFNNEAYQRWLGLSPHKIYGSHLQTVHGGEEYQKIKPHIDKVLSGEIVTYEKEATFQDGHIHTVNVTYIPHINQHKKAVIKGFFALTSDISDRKAIERMKDEFISVVSHELRTPLTSIHSSLKILATGKLGNLSDKGHRMLTIADEQTDRLVRLVNNVLDLQSIQSGKIKMNKKACSATDLMLEACQAMQTMANERGVELVSEPVNFLVWADYDYIVQTLTNLLSNAIKFSLPDSIISLSARIYPPKRDRRKPPSISYLTFAVKDQGQGIPENQLETIFERFQQVDSSDSRKKGGTGLGLTICRQIIEGHGGEIWAESRRGKGSTFYFTLPLLINEGGRLNEP